MSKLIDLTGQRFGRLTVKERADNKGNLTRFKCICDCGNETVAYSCNLKAGKTRSCGCLEKENREKYTELMGRRFGRLVVVKKTDTRKGQCVVWECKCDCGNVTKVRSTFLLNGTTKSCGCLRYETQLENVSVLREFKYDGTCILSISEDRAINKNNTSGVRGVTYDKSRRKWCAQIMLRHKNIHLGRYDKVEDAVKARKIAEEKLFLPIMEEYQQLSNE